MEADRAEVRRILGIDPKAEELNVVYGSNATNDKEIAILTRSMLEILIDLSSYIEVPAASATERRTFPTPAPETVNGVPVAPLVRILSSHETPADAFAAVPYRKDWYWIDDKTWLPSGFFLLSCFCSRSPRPREVSKERRSSRSRSGKDRSRMCNSELRSSFNSVLNLTLLASPAP